MTTLTHLWVLCTCEGHTFINCTCTTVLFLLLLHIFTAVISRWNMILTHLNHTAAVNAPSATDTRSPDRQALKLHLISARLQISFLQVYLYCMYKFLSSVIPPNNIPSVGAKVHHVFLAIGVKSDVSI